MVGAPTSASADPPRPLSPTVDHHGLAPAWQPFFFKYLTLALWLFTSWHAFMPDPGGSGVGNLDKLMHFAAFLALSVSANLAAERKRQLAWPLATALLAYGALIEIAQIWIPGRDASWLDLLSDACGIACGVALSRVLLRWGPLRRSRQKIV